MRSFKKYKHLLTFWCLSMTLGALISFCWGFEEEYLPYFLTSAVLQGFLTLVFGGVWETFKSLNTYFLWWFLLEVVFWVTQQVFL